MVSQNLQLESPPVGELGISEVKISDAGKPSSAFAVGLTCEVENWLGAATEDATWALPQESFKADLRRTLRTVGPFVLGDLLALLASGAIALGMLSVVWHSTWSAVHVTGPVSLAVLMLTYLIGGLYQEMWVHPVVELRQIVRLNSAILAAAAAAGGFYHPLFAAWCALTWITAFLAVPMSRVTLRHVLARFAWWGFPTLIIGSSEDADRLALSLLKVPHCSLRPSLITDPDGKARSCVLPAVNNVVTLGSLLRVKRIRHAVLSLPKYTTTRQRRALDHYARQIPHLLVLSDSSTLPALWAASRSVGQLSGVEMRNGLLLRRLQLVKRLSDLGLLLASLPLTLPLITILAVLMKLTSRGPVFFGHLRIGQHGKQFKVWKFRTMHVNSAQMLAEHLQNNPEARAEWAESHKLKDDPRVTFIGNILRKTSLDELPQLWNVLRGEMSFVGPRPIVQGEVERYNRAIYLYGAVKGGVTGLWQVSGRTDIGYRERVELDLFYIRNWSPWLDIYILAKTIVVLLARRGAY